MLATISVQNLLSYRLLSEKLNIKILKDTFLTILPGVLYGCTP